MAIGRIEPSQMVAKAEDEVDTTKVELTRSNRDVTLPSAIVVVESRESVMLVSRRASLARELVEGESERVPPVSRREVCVSPFTRPRRQSSTPETRRAALELRADEAM